MPSIEWLWRGWLGLMIMITGLAAAEAVTDIAKRPAIQNDHGQAFEHLVPAEAWEQAGFTA